MIPDETVDRVREAADIVQIIGEYVSLKRVGSDYRGPCPFHQGTHRNFSVSTRKRMFYCFVCHEGGDVFNFLQKRLGLDWPGAVKLVAEKSGIEVREVDTRREGPDPREPLWELNATAAEYFRRMLWDDAAGAPARDYLAQRGVSREAAERFGLGFAPREIGLLRSYMNTLGFDDARLLDGGLLVQREDGSEPRPRFRNRLMFPILDASGHHAGFGGRMIGPGEPKYLNSADSRTFSKGKLLYNLHSAKHAIRRDERALVVEGYFDVVRLVVAGIESVVAPLGTALTEEQAALLARYTKNVFLLYDSDKAGLKATFRSGDELLAHGMSVRVVTLPEGEDPDTFVAREGAERLEAQLAAAVDVFDRKVQLLERAGWFADLHRKRRAIDRLLPTIRATADAVTRDLYLAHVSASAGVAKEVLLRELAERAPALAPSRASSREAGGASRGSAGLGDDERRTAVPDRRLGERRRQAALRGTGAERELVRVMLQRRNEVESIAERQGPDGFLDPDYREIFSALLTSPPELPVEQLAELLSESAAHVMQELLSEPDAVVDAQKSVEGSLAQLRMRELNARRREINGELPLASEEQKAQLFREKEAIRDEIRSLGGVGFNWFDTFTR